MCLKFDQFAGSRLFFLPKKKLVSYPKSYPQKMWIKKTIFFRKVSILLFIHHNEIYDSKQTAKYGFVMA